MTSPAVACAGAPSVLGEGVRWDDRRAELLRVDILAGQLFRSRVADDGDLVAVRSYDLAGTVGAAAPVAGDDGWLLAAGRGVSHLAADGTRHPLVELAPAGTRLNDGACDPQGRFWTGTLTEDHRIGGGALYRLDPDGRTAVVLEGLTISNGLGWSPDGTTMYLADSGPRTVTAFRFDGPRGAIADGHVLITIDEDVGAPDGLTVDAAGDLWVAVFGGGRVVRYGHDGTPRQTVPIPAAQTTSCAFGGPGLRRLYVTTATEGWSDEQRRADPAAGLVYRVDTDAVGRPAAPFRPEPGWWAAATG